MTVDLALPMALIGLLVVVLLLPYTWGYETDFRRERRECRGQAASQTPPPSTVKITASAPAPSNPKSKI